MKVPAYVWISGIILFTIAEFRRWIELIVSYKNENCDEEEEEHEPMKLNKEIPKAVQHLYS